MHAARWSGRVVEGDKGEERMGLKANTNNSSTLAAVTSQVTKTTENQEQEMFRLPSPQSTCQPI